MGLSSLWRLHYLRMQWRIMNSAFVRGSFLLKGGPHCWAVGCDEWRFVSRGMEGSGKTTMYSAELPCYEINPVVFPFVRELPRPSHKFHWTQGPNFLAQYSCVWFWRYWLCCVIWRMTGTLMLNDVCCKISQARLRVSTKPILMYGK